MAEERTIDQVTSEELFEGTRPQEPAPAEPTPVPTPAPEPQPTPVAPAPVAPVEAEIPSWRLREEAEARRAAEERARILEERLAQVAQHMKQQGEKQPDFFENPNQATQHLILQTLQPYAEEQRRVTMYMGKMIAGAVHGTDVVDKAEEAFLKAREQGVLDTMDYERVVQSPNRYDEVVRWHNRQNVLSSVGNDPNAWFEKQLEAKMADPQFQAQFLEKIRGSAATKPGTVQIPPSLSRATAVAAGNSSGSPLGDMSDSSLWEWATKSDKPKR